MALSFLYLAFTNILQLIRLRNRDCDELTLEVVNSSPGEAPACAASVYVLGMASLGNPPAAVLLDAGGVFVLPDPDRILGAFVRAECSVSREVLADAHYRAAVRFRTNVDVEANWSEAWLDYLQTYVAECGVPPDWREEAHFHIDSEFADAALWVEPIPGSREGLRALADTGVRLGIVSNADGLMAQRLAHLELCQVGPGIGVEIECVVDSGNVGVMKPDPRIFEAAVDLLGLRADQVWYVGDMPAIDVVGARRAGIRPFLMDPLSLHLDASYERVPSLAALADLVMSSSPHKPPT
jgi:putative hydrolase of the HAD superfamily